MWGEVPRRPDASLPGGGEERLDLSGVRAPGRGRYEDQIMKVLVACEFSGVVRDAFIRRGHDAWSCDLEPCERGIHRHLQRDVAEVLDWGWDLMVAHPPCTHLAVSGARWFKDKQWKQAEALAFVGVLLAAPIPKIALENPISIISTHFRKPEQIIQPWMFGHGETKAMCLWLQGLLPLTPTDMVEGRANRIHMMPGSKNQAKNRSRFYPGVAQAMAEQWG